MGPFIKNRPDFRGNDKRLNRKNAKTFTRSNFFRRNRVIVTNWADEPSFKSRANGLVRRLLINLNANVLISCSFKIYTKRINFKQFKKSTIFIY